VHPVTTPCRRCSPTSGLPCASGVCSTSGAARCSSTRPTAASRTPRTPARHAHGPRPDGRRPRTSVNGYDGRALARLLKEYGDERFASRIADAIVRERAQAPLTSTARLADLVRDAIPAATRRTGGHPAKRTFQALRIEVNDELGVLRSAIPSAVDSLCVGGRLVVLSYQSLEDKIVKSVLVTRSASTVPVDLPFVPEGSAPELRLLVQGAQKASAAEVAANPRAASVRLRAAERTRRAA
jgi:16S rRNA (cytosine1402-N4)-methyltransferase